MGGNSSAKIYNISDQESTQQSRKEKTSSEERE